MDGVDLALNDLDVVGLIHDLGGDVLVRRHVEVLELGHLRLELGWAHVGPDHSGALSAGVGLDLDLVLEVALGGLRRHVDAFTVHVELPAVVYATEAGLLVAAEKEAGSTVRAVVVDEADVAVGVAEGDEWLAQDGGALGRAVGFRELLREEHGVPEAAHEVAHGRPGAGLRHVPVFFLGEHLAFPSVYASRTSVRLSGSIHALEDGRQFQYMGQ